MGNEEIDNEALASLPTELRQEILWEQAVLRRGRRQQYRRTFPSARHEEFPPAHERSQMREREKKKTHHAAVYGLNSKPMTVPTDGRKPPPESLSFPPNFNSSQNGGNLKCYVEFDTCIDGAIGLGSATKVGFSCSSTVAEIVPEERSLYPLSSHVSLASTSSTPSSNVASAAASTVKNPASGVDPPGFPVRRPHSPIVKSVCEKSFPSPSIKPGPSNIAITRTMAYSGRFHSISDTLSGFQPGVDDEVNTNEDADLTEGMVFGTRTATAELARRATTNEDSKVILQDIEKPNVKLSKEDFMSAPEEDKDDDNLSFYDYYEGLIADGKHPRGGVSSEDESKCDRHRNNGNMGRDSFSSRGRGNESKYNNQEGPSEDFDESMQDLNVSMQDLLFEEPLSGTETDDSERDVDYDEESLLALSGWNITTFRELPKDMRDELLQEERSKYTEQRHSFRDLRKFTRENKKREKSCPNLVVGTSKKSQIRSKNFSGKSHDTRRVESNRNRAAKKPHDYNVSCPNFGSDDSLSHDSTISYNRNQHGHNHSMYGRGYDSHLVSDTRCSDDFNPHTSRSSGRAQSSNRAIKKPYDYNLSCPNFGSDDSLSYDSTHNQNRQRHNHIMLSERGNNRSDLDTYNGAHSNIRAIRPSGRAQDSNPAIRKSNDHNVSCPGFDCYDDSRHSQNYERVTGINDELKNLGHSLNEGKNRRCDRDKIGGRQIRRNDPVNMTTTRETTTCDTSKPHPKRCGASIRRRNSSDVSSRTQGWKQTSPNECSHDLLGSDLPLQVSSQQPWNPRVQADLTKSLPRDVLRDSTEGMAPEQHIDPEPFSSSNTVPKQEVRKSFSFRFPQESPRLESFDYSSPSSPLAFRSCFDLNATPSLSKQPLSSMSPLPMPFSRDPLSQISASHRLTGFTTHSRHRTCTYKGDYNQLGQRHGKGKLIWENGDRYEGDFWNGDMEGVGCATFINGDEYSGRWKDDQFHGEGIYHYANGNIYQGNYNRGKRHGKGTCFFANGDHYDGDWKDDAIHGHGTFHYSRQGSSFEGIFCKWKRHGKGKYTMEDGGVEIFRYAHGERVGVGVRWSANGKKAWRRVAGGEVEKQISLKVAASIANACGSLLEKQGGKG